MLGAAFPPVRHMHVPATPISGWEWAAAAFLVAMLVAVVVVAVRSVRREARDVPGSADIVSGTERRAA